MIFFFLLISVHQEFDFRAHDSAFKDRYLQLQNVRLSFIPTDKNDVHDLGPMEDVNFHDFYKCVFFFKKKVDTFGILCTCCSTDQAGHSNFGEKYTCSSKPND